ncbi:MAG: DUF4157 domain-containing protein [Myxococcales bacterium]|nr:DUF4157 domain-containing protein [Myxococcales bacterium]
MSSWPPASARTCACGGGCPRCAGAATIPAGGGRPLDGALRARFEAGLGASLGGVRVHQGPAAAAAASRLGARAFALGSDLVLGRDRFPPRTPAERWVLAHELVHVAQRSPGGGDPQGAVEAEARDLASAALLGLPARPRRRHDGRRPLLFGEPEEVPDLTFVAAERGAGFLQEAFEYHDAWGLSPTRIGSVEDLVHRLAGSTDHLGRIRLVAHAEEFGVYLRLVQGENRETLLEERLAAWAGGPEAGLRFEVGTPFGEIGPETQARILAAIREEHAAILAPFGLDRSGLPSGPLAELIQRATDLQVLADARTDENGDRIDVMVAGVEMILGQARAAVREAGGLSDEDVDRIIGFARRAIRGTSTYSPSPANAARVEAVVNALGGPFPADLEAARQRFDASSWIDIRGCNVGEREDYLRAVAAFFGRGGVVPHVSAPTWYQVFPRMVSRPLADDAAIVALLPTSGFAAALDRWASITGVHGEIGALRAFYRGELDRRRAAAAAEAAPTEGAPAEAAPTEAAPTEAAPTEAAPTEAAPTEAAPTEAAPTEAAPTEAAEGGSAAEPAAAPSSIPQPTSPADRALVSHLADPAGTPLSSSGIRSPRFSLTLPRDAEDPLAALIERALSDLEGPNALALYYFHAPHLLPAFRASSGYGQGYYYLESLAAPALRNWLASQWVQAAPGQAALARRGINDDDPRRVQGLISGAEADDSDLVFPPDPTYWSHIRRI